MNFQKTGFRAPKKGFDMIQLGLVLTIGAILLGAAFLLFERRTRATEIAENTTNLTEVASQLQARYGKAGRYPQLTTEVAVKSGIVPAGLRTGADTARNSYGGDITVAPTAAADCGGSNNGCVTLTWSAVPNNQCNDLVSGSEAAARAITVGGVAVKALNGALDAALVADSCDNNAAATKDLVFIIGR